MTKDILLVFVLGVTSLSQCSPAVNLIIQSQKKPIDLRCPIKVTGQRLDTRTGIKKDISSVAEVTFNCQLYYDVYQTVPYGVRYHVSMIPLFNLSIVGCPKLDGCLWMYLRHVPPHDFVEVKIKSHVLCLYQTLPFKYELRQLSVLIQRGYVDVHVGQKPPKPGHFKFKKDKGLLFISGPLTPMCRTDVLFTRYFMSYELTSPSCTYSNESECRLQSGDTFLLFCSVNNRCDHNSLCNVQLSAFVYGVNKFKMIGDRSPRFSNILAMASTKSLSTEVSNSSLNSLTLSFKKPVNCTSTFSHFQYKISYTEVDLENKWIYIIDKSCQNLLTCEVRLAGLKSNTSYKICVQYLPYFDYASSYSHSYCINATTGQLPCKTPEIYNVTPVTSDNNFWNAIVRWKPLDPLCWHDLKKQYYVMNLHQQNSASSMMGVVPANGTSRVISSLAYTEQYTLVILACNSYGCIPGINYRLEVVYNEKVDRSETSSTQRIAETILICVLSVLFLGVSTKLYCILRKRKHSSRFPRNLRAEDIQLVAQLPESQLSVGRETVSQPLMQPKNNHNIPENSTLV